MNSIYPRRSQLRWVATRTSSVSGGTRHTADEIEALAESSGKTKSELVRDALRRQVRLERLSSLQSIGREQAEAAGIGPEDVEDLIDQFRAE